METLYIMCGKKEQLACNQIQYIFADGKLFFLNAVQCIMIIIVPVVLEINEGIVEQSYGCCCCMASEAPY